MIPDNAYDYCCEDISLIENYEEALADKTQTWICHHRKGIELNKTPDELKEMGLYFNRPACELMFVTRSEHRKIHLFNNNYAKGNIPWNKGKKGVQTAWNKGKKGLQTAWNKGKKGYSLSKKPKYYWKTPDGEIKIMDKSNAHHHHPDWVLIGPA